MPQALPSPPLAQPCPFLNKQALKNCPGTLPPFYLEKPHQRHATRSTSVPPNPTTHVENPASHVENPAWDVGFFSSHVEISICVADFPTPFCRSLPTRCSKTACSLLLPRPVISPPVFIGALGPKCQIMTGRATCKMSNNDRFLAD